MSSFSETYSAKITESILFVMVHLFSKCPSVKKYIEQKKEGGRKLLVFGNIAAGAALGSMISMHFFEKIEVSMATAILTGSIAGISGYYDEKLNTTDAIRKLKYFLDEYINKIQSGSNISDKNHGLYLPPGTKKVKNIESLLHLRYWCFLALLSYQPPHIIESILETKKSISAGVFTEDSVLGPILEKSVSGKELLHFNYYKNDKLKPEFFIVVDHLSSSIVLSIKGSEYMTDTSINVILGLSNPGMTRMTLSGEHPGNFLAISIFHDAAVNVIKSCIKYIYLFVEKYPDYDIKVTGHSYGAGIAAIVAWMLENERIDKNLKTNRSIRGLLFCCPPVFNLYAAEISCYFLVSVVMGWDCMSSMSLNNLFKFVCSNVKVEGEEETVMDNCLTVEDPYLKSIYCSTYVPGTVYWLTYDEVTQEVDGLHIIYRSNDRLQNLIIHENMARDNYGEKLYAYLLALIIKEERGLERNEKFAQRKQRKEEMDKIDTSKRSEPFKKLIHFKKDLENEKDPERTKNLKRKIDETEGKLRDMEFVLKID